MVADWHRAHGAPLCGAALKTTADDFVVDEVLGFEPDGDGEHDLLHVEKRDTNTVWLARQLARHAGIPERDVGYSGLKDRRAVTRQWFSVRRPSGGTNWSGFRLDNIDVLAVESHRRKLRTGSHRANRFELTLRSEQSIDADALMSRVGAIACRGVPNYFGDQRFGIDASNLKDFDALAAGRRLSRNRRSLALSAARSLLFNRILDYRVRLGLWDRLVDGDRANLDGSGSLFAVERVDEALVERCRMLDVHPTGSLWGRSAPCGGERSAELEREALSELSDTAEALERLGVDAASRALRMRVIDLYGEVTAVGIRLCFELGRGSYATAVVREIVDAIPADPARSAIVE